MELWWGWFSRFRCRPTQWTVELSWKLPSDVSSRKDVRHWIHHRSVAFTGHPMEIPLNKRFCAGWCKNYGRVLRCHRETLSKIPWVPGVQPGCIKDVHPYINSTLKRLVKSLLLSCRQWSDQFFAGYIWCGICWLKQGFNSVTVWKIGFKRTLRSGCIKKLGITVFNYIGGHHPGQKWILS